MQYLSKLSIGVQIIDKEMRYAFLNPALLKQVDKTLEEHVGKKMEEVYPGFNETEIYQTIQQCHQTGEFQKVYSEFVFEDGRMTYWELEVSKVDEDVIIFSRDITDTKKGEIALKESNARLESAIKERTKELEESYLRMKRIVGYVSHDLRGPLGNIRALASMLKPNDEHEKSIVGFILNQSQKSLNLVHNILDDAALGVGKIQLEISSNNLSEMVLKRVDLIKTMNVLHKNELKLAVHPSVIRKFDPFRIGQVLDNLFSNAIKYARKDTTIDVSLSNEGLFSITNQINQSKVANKKPSVLESVGFGIEIVNSILNAHGSKLIVTNDKDRYHASFRL